MFYLSKSYFRIIIIATIASYSIVGVLFFYAFGQRFYETHPTQTTGTRRLLHPSHVDLKIDISNWLNKKTSEIHRRRPFKSDTNKINRSEYSDVNFNEPHISSFQYIDSDTYFFSAFWDDRYSKKTSGKNHYIRLFILKRWSRQNSFNNRPRDFARRFYGSDDKDFNIDSYTCTFNQNQYRNKTNTFNSSGVLYETCENHDMQWGTFYVSCQTPASYTMHLLNTFATKPFSSIIITFSHNNHSRMVPVKLPEEWLNFNKSLRSRVTNAGICVPPLYGNFSSDAIITFVELSKIIGAHKLFFYLTTDDDAAYPYLKILRHYELLGQVTITPWFLPLDHASKQVWNYGQSLSIADCLYRNMYKYDLLAFNDVDEFIVPRKHKNWQTMINDASSNWPANVSGLRVKGAFFEANTKRQPISFNGHSVFDITKRTTMLSSVRTKCLVKPKLIFEQGIHHISKQTYEEIPPDNADPDLLILHHYRPCNRGYDMNCEDYIFDNNLKRYEKEFYKRKIII
ncbi:unnamed protein product [Gordionus sp. m RMFG-2023]|uniref:beta-1,4-galactosyltransferase galt-1-like isoform X1 n=1 Tax=Gordionus sp. m RMFG-2023 TaxID=3053472 RepID=UPI0030DF6BCA